MFATVFCWKLLPGRSLRSTLAPSVHHQGDTQASWTCRTSATSLRHRPSCSWPAAAADEACRAPASRLFAAHTRSMRWCACVTARTVRERRLNVCSPVGAFVLWLSFYRDTRVNQLIKVHASMQRALACLRRRITHITRVTHRIASSLQCTFRRPRRAQLVAGVELNAGQLRAERGPSPPGQLQARRRGAWTRGAAGGCACGSG